MSTTTELLTVKAELQRVTAELAALRGGVEALAGEWRAEADDDQAWLDGPRVAASEARELPALIRQARQHVRDVRDLLGADS